MAGSMEHDYDASRAGGAHEDEKKRDPHVRGGKTRPDRVANITEQFVRMDRFLWNLGSTIDDLTVKLGSVLMPERPSLAEKSPGDDTPEMSDVARRLTDQGNQLARLTGRLSELFRRIDL